MVVLVLKGAAEVAAVSHQEHGAAKLADGRHQDGLLHGQGLGAHGGAKGVGDVIGACGAASQSVGGARGLG